MTKTNLKDYKMYLNFPSWPWWGFVMLLAYQANIFWLYSLSICFFILGGIIKPMRVKAENKKFKNDMILDAINDEVQKYNEGNKK